MRTLLVDHTGLMGGAEHSLIELARGLAERGEVVVACPDGPFAERLTEHGISWRRSRGSSASLRLHPVRTPAALNELRVGGRELRRLVASFRPDVIHANSVRAALICSAMPGRDVPLVGHVRDVLEPGPLTSSIVAVLGRRTDAIIAVSRASAKPFGPEARVIDNAVDLDRFRPDAAARSWLREELGLPLDARVAVHVAQITPWKDQRLSIEAVARAGSQGRALHLAVVGEVKFVERSTTHDNTAYLDELRRLTEALGVRGRVHFLGERRDVPRIVAGADVALMPSWNEPFGRSVAEAMASGTPVLATSCGGPAELIGDGIDGRLLEPRSTGAWSTTLATLVGDQEELDRLGAAAHETAQRRFGRRSVVDRVLDTYRVAGVRDVPKTDDTQ